jgi:hypothetical protein
MERNLGNIRRVFQIKPNRISPISSNESTQVLATPTLTTTVEDSSTKTQQQVKLMFTFPGSGTLSKALTGLDATLEAPVNRLSQGIQAFPALGPMAQIAVSKMDARCP